jgi:hypothetical protein
MRFVSAIAFMSAAVSMVLLGLRVGGAVSFAEPLQVITSGWEQESLVALWERLHGGAIYVSRFDIPYRWSIYNWLFYVSYGAGIEAVVGPLALSDAWIPTVGRLLTLGGVAAGVVLATYSFVAVLGPGRRPLTFAFAVLVAAGPLVAAVGLGLYLLARRRWTPMFVLAATMAAAWGATLVLGPSAYVNSIFMVEDMAVLSAAHGVSVLVNFTSKFVPGLLGAAAIAVVLARSGRLAAAWRDDDALAFATAGILAGALLVAATTPRVGSSESYYFIVAYFIALFVLAGLRSMTVEGTDRRLVLGALSRAWP